MKEYALLHGKQVVRVVRKDHYGDKRYWLVDFINFRVEGAVHLNFVNAHDCTLLDPALNVLFERKENE